MGQLPVPGEIYLNDFPDKTTYTITRDGQAIGDFDGLTNSDEGGNHIAFLYGTKIEIGDIISSEFETPIKVKATGIDTYNGTAEIIKAYY